MQLTFIRDQIENQDLKHDEHEDSVDDGDDDKNQENNGGDEAMAIGLRFRIDQIQSINTVEQSYAVISSLDMDWLATQKDMESFKNDPREYTPEKVPRIDPRNITSKETNYKPWANGNLYKIVEKDGKHYNLRRIEYIITWTHPLDVANFPFDVQDLVFVFQSREFNTGKQRIFVPSRLFPTFFRIEKTYLAVEDWEFINCDAYVQQLDISSNCWSAIC